MQREDCIWHQHGFDKNWRDGYPECSMYEQLKMTADKIIDKDAIVFEGKKITYRKLLEEIDIVTEALSSCDLKKGDIVSIIMPNIPQAVYLFYGLNRLGVIANMIHPLFSKEEIKESIESTNSKMIFILDQIFPKIKMLEWDMEKAPTIVLATITDALPIYAKPVYSMKVKKKPLRQNHDQKTIEWRDFIKSKDDKKVELIKGDKDAVAAIMMSGGTTGKPKGVMLTNYNFTSNTTQLLGVSNFDCPVDNDYSTISFIPIFHGFGLGIGVHAMLCYGVKIYMMPVFSLEKCASLFIKKKVNIIIAVPSFYEVLSRSDKIENMDLSFVKLMVSGGDKLPGDLANRMNDIMKKGNATTYVREAYGQTECVCVCAINPYFAPKPETPGLPYPDMHVKIVEPGTTNELKANEPGELCVNGPIVMKGYFNNEEATKKALQVHEDGKTWLHTGDMFSIDEDGYLHFSRRMNRMIIVSGYNVYLTQIEEIVGKLDFVNESCAVGMDDQVEGKSPVLFVSTDGKIGEEDAKKNIASICEDNLPAYSQPRHIIFMDKLPRTTVGKIDCTYLGDKEVIRKCLEKR